MTDDDRATELEALGRARALKVRRPEGPQAAGFCLSCSEPVPAGLRWCDASYRDDRQREQARKGR